MWYRGNAGNASKIVSIDLDTSGFGIFMNGFGELFSHPDCIVALFSLLFVDFLIPQEH